MLISYNWLKWYVPEIPAAEKLADIFNYHLCEVETVEKKSDDFVFDLKILPNRAHDLLSHQGVARELASLLNIEYVDPTPKYKIPASLPTGLEVKIDSDKCRRYMGRIVRGVKVGPSPDWMVKHLEAIGQRSINSIVDASNIVMFDCGAPTHAFDLDKINGSIVIREAKDEEKITTLDNRDLTLMSTNLAIADSVDILAIAGVKGGKQAEVTEHTINIILEVANFDPISVRRTAQALNIFTDARKRFENDLSPELATYAMRELSALIAEICPGAVFEEIVDEYPIKQKKRELSFFTDRISKILGMKVLDEQVEDILKRYNFEYRFDPTLLPPRTSGRVREGSGEGGGFQITVPSERLDLNIEEDMTEEVGRILGYDKVKPEIPKINLPELPSGKTGFTPKENATHAKISWVRYRLLTEGYSEVMTYTFQDNGEVEVMQSASDKKFLRTNLGDGLKESLKLNQLNASLLGSTEVKIFEIGTVWDPKEKICVAYSDGDKITEATLDNFCKTYQDYQREPLVKVAPESGSSNLETKFKMWSLFPFIVRDVSVWVSGIVQSDQVSKIIQENAGELLVKGPDLFDEFSKGDRKSCAFRLVFQSPDRTLTDLEVNKIMQNINEKLVAKDWQVR